MPHQMFTVLILLALTACAAPASGPIGATAQPAVPPGVPPQRKSIEIVTRAGPNAFVTEAGGLAGPTARPSRYFHEFVNAYVTVRDGDDEVAPHLAAALPSLE